MAFNFSEETQLFNQHYLITPIFTLCTGPAFYLFITHLVFEDRRWTWNEALHFLPALIAILFTRHTAMVIALGSLSLLIYGVLAYRWLLRYRAASFNTSSDAEDMRLDWLSYLILAFAFLGVTDIIRLNLQSSLSYELANTWYFLHQSTVLLLYTTLAALAVHQPALFDGLSSYQPISQDLDNAVYRALFDEVDNTLVTRKLYRQPRLSLNDVAAALELGPKDVSMAVNVGAGKSFCDYINGLRVNDIKQRLIENPDIKTPLLSIAMDAGFNSKSSFNAVFKSMVGMTPKQFAQSQRATTREN